MVMGSRPASRQSLDVSDPAESCLADFFPAGSLVELLRLELNLSRRELADRLGVAPQTVANWEKRTGRLHLHPRTHRALAARYADTQA
jgi:DNA-binding transcriptional regulator YiaG